jgi:methylase of polypeptide subunit release factors
MFEKRTIDLRALEMMGGRELARVLARKTWRRIAAPFGHTLKYERAAIYGGIVVFDTPNLHGEGTSVGQDYIRALLELGFKRCESIFEFCAGPGYIGYSLLGHGFCEKLTLADINPAAVEIAQKTARFNQLDQVVSIYESDCLDRIPEAEAWDLVVSNPPHFLPRDSNDKDIRVFDPDWSIHKRFYANVKRFMKPGGHVVMMENGKQSGVDFRPMIDGGGGAFVTERQGVDVTGKPNGMYYVVSRWE